MSIADTPSTSTITDRRAPDEAAPASETDIVRPTPTSLQDPDTPILEAHPPKPRVDLTHEAVIEGDDAETLWETYRSNFAELESEAILQHMFDKDEVLAEFADPRIIKVVGWEGSEPVGLGMLTKHLEAVPQISPRYLRAKYPEHAELDRIYYGILVAISPGYRGRTLSQRLYMEMWNIPATEGGVLIFDVCQYNRTNRDADAMAQLAASMFPGGSVGHIDSQTWYAAELPNPLPGT